MDPLRARYKEVQKADEVRNGLIEELLSKIDDVQTQLDRGSFVLVVLDGNYIHFRDDLISQGIEGGQQAATYLTDAVFNHLSQDPSITHGFEVVIRVYANLRGIGEPSSTEQMTPGTHQAGRFAEGFNQAYALCDFVHAGDQEMVSAKIKGILKSHADNILCKHIVLGESLDTDFTQFLRDNISTDGASGGLTILQDSTAMAVPSHFSNGPPVLAFENVLKDTQISTDWWLQNGAPVSQVATSPMTSPASQAKRPMGTISSAAHASRTSHPDHNAPTPPIATSNSSFPFQKGTKSSDAHTSRTARWTSSSLGGPASSWKAKTSTNKAPAQSTGSLKSPQRTRPVYQNSHGQRVDVPVTMNPDPHSLRAIRNRKKKLCNHFYLNGSCRKRHDCPFDHEPTITRAERQTLLYVARCIPCPNGSACEASDCTSGHRCPYLPNCTRKNCKFNGLHDIDTGSVDLIGVEWTENESHEDLAADGHASSNTTTNARYSSRAYNPSPTALGESQAPSNTTEAHHLNSTAGDSMLPTDRTDTAPFENAMENPPPASGW